jgi:pimeloyl-ACP methyl ester carboxylesterase
MDKVISGDGTAVAYERVGNGPALVVVNGAFCDHNSSMPLAAALSADFTVLTYDRRGRGGSGDNQPYAVEREIEDLEAVIKTVGDTAFVYGESSGGALTFRAAAAGGPITRLAVMEPPYRVEGAPPAPEKYIETITELTSTGRHGDAVAYFMTAAVGQPPEAVEEARKLPMWADLEAMTPTLVYDALVMGDNQVPTDLLACVKVPTLMLDSTASPDWLRGASAAAAKGLPDAEHRSLDGTFHTIPPEILAPTLKGFFLG